MMVTIQPLHSESDLKSRVYGTIFHLHDTIDWPNSAFLEMGNGQWWIEIELRDEAARLEIEHALALLKGELSQVQQVVNFGVHCAWALAGIEEASGLSYAASGGPMTARRFCARLVCGSRIITVLVDLTSAAEAQLCRSRTGRFTPLDAAKMFLEMSLKRRGSEYWDPQHSSTLTLDEAALSYTLMHRVR